MANEEICCACNRGTPPRIKGKKKPDKIQWIGCETCLRWFHSVCMRINESQMETSDDYAYFCDSCSVRGTFVRKLETTASASTTSAPSNEVEELKKTVQELSAQLFKLQTELDSVRTNSKKQIDRLQNQLHNSVRSDAVQSRLVDNLDEKLEAIENGARLASACSRTVNSCRVAINKIPFKAGEDINNVVGEVLALLGCGDEWPSIKSCFRLPVKPSKWTDRSLTPTIVVVFSCAESRQRVLRKYYERHKEMKLCNLKKGPGLDYRFTMNEVLSMDTFRIRNHALRLKQLNLVRSVFVRNDKVSVLLPGQKRYVPIGTVGQLQELTKNDSVGDASSIFFDAMSADISASSRC